MKLQKGQLSNIHGPDEKELAETLRKIHETNARTSAGEISWQERVRIHKALVPGIRELGGACDRPRATYEPRTVDLSEVRHALRDLE